MAFRIYPDDTVIRIVDESGNNEPIQYNPGEVKYYTRAGLFYFFDGVGGQDFNNHDFTEFRDEDGSTFESHGEFITYLNGFINACSQILINTADAPALTRLDELYRDDVDWEASDFSMWEGDPKSLLGNVNDGGIYCETADNPKYFTLRLVRTRKFRDFGIGSNTGSFSNVKATVLGSNNQSRGVLDASEDPSKETSFVYSEEEFVINAIKVEFFTPDRVDVTNIFLKYTYSDKEQNYINKFGLNPDIDSGESETVWTLGGQYIFTETPRSYYISSGSAADVGQVIEVETIGLTAEGRYQREITEVVLNGNVKTLIPTTLLCVASNRAFNTSNAPIQGTVYIYEDGAVTGGVPDDLTTVRSVLAVGKEQTEQAVYTVPEFLEDGRKVVSADLYKWDVKLIRNRSASGIAGLYVANRGQVARIRDIDGLSDSTVAGNNFGKDTPLSIEAGADIYLQASEVSANDVAVSGRFTLKLIVL